MSMTPDRTRKLLEAQGAILKGHFVGTSGLHLDTYVAKDRATLLSSVASKLCCGIAERFADEDIDAVVSPALGGIALSQWTAHHLTRLRPDRPEVLTLYAEHQEDVITASKYASISLDIIDGRKTVSVTLEKGDQLIIKHPASVLRRGFAADVNGRRILLVEDILTTGGSARRAAHAVIDVGGNLIAIGVLANGGNVTATDLGVRRLEALMDVNRNSYSEADCADHGLCFKGIPVNTEYGHGKAFLERSEVEQG